MRVIDILMKLWAIVPFLALTDDKGFLAADLNSWEHAYYFSVVNFLFGEVKCQFISIPIKQPGKKWKFIRVTKLSEMDKFILSERKMEELKTNFDEHFCSLTNDEICIETESLARHLSEQNARIEVSYNKINAFTTIIVAVIPIITTLLDKNKLMSLNLFGKFVFAILVYANINVCAWIFQANTVRGFLRSSFGDMKKSKCKQREYMWQIYFDWQQTKREADMFVSFVAFTKEAIIAVMLLTPLFCWVVL